MNLNEVLNRHTKTIRKGGSYISLTSGNSSAIWPIIERLSFRDLDLLRTLHLELTLEPESSDSVEQFLIDHIDLNLAQLLDSSYPSSKYDRTTELGFESRSKMQSLFNLLHLRAYSSISQAEFSSKYTSWLAEHGITDLLNSQSSRDINEIFTFFIIQEQSQEFFSNFTQILENMIDDVYSDYTSRLLALGQGKKNNEFSIISPNWNSKAEKIFGLMDEDRKGHVDAEGLQLWTVVLVVGKAGTVEPILLRKQTFNVMQEIKHANGLVSMRAWKNYLVKKGWLSEQVLDQFLKDLIKVKDLWKKARDIVFQSETFVKAEGEGKWVGLHTLWEQCVVCCVNVVKSKKEIEKLYKFLRFTGLLLGSTPNLATKGIVYLQGTHLRDVGEFSVYLMNNYLQLSGQYHTSASFSALTQQALDSLSSDSRFQAIRKTLQTYDSLMNIVLYELIASFEKSFEKPEKPLKSKEEAGFTWQYSSNTSILNGIARSVSYSKPRAKSPNQQNVRASGKSPKTNSSISDSNSKIKSFKNNQAENHENAVKPDKLKHLRSLTPTKMNKSQKSNCSNVDSSPKAHENNLLAKQGISPLRSHASRIANKPKTPARAPVNVDVKVVLAKSKSGLNTSRTPEKVKEKPKETYEQVIKRLMTKK